MKIQFQMKQKQLTKTFMISNKKKHTLWSLGLYKNMFFYKHFKG